MTVAELIEILKEGRGDIVPDTCWADPLTRNERAVLARKLANASRRFYHAPCAGRRREGDPKTARMSRRMASAEMSDLHLDVTERAEVAAR